MKVLNRSAITCISLAIALNSSPAHAQSTELPDPLGLRAQCVKAPAPEPQDGFERLLASPEEYFAEIEALKRRAIAATVVLEVSRCDDKNACAALKSNGTGTAVSADGLVLTAFHVVRDSVAVKATFRAIDADGHLVLTGRTRMATVVAVSPDKDAALLKLEPDAEPYPHLAMNCRWQAPKKSLVWHFGKTTGQAYGRVTLQSTESVDVVGVYETTARADFGDSGAPFVKKTGEMIGILLSINDTTGKSYYMPVADAIVALEKAASAK